MTDPGFYQILLGEWAPVAVAVGLACGIGLGCLERWLWLGDLASHWRRHAAILLLVAAGGCAAHGSPRIAGCSALIGLTAFWTTTGYGRRTHRAPPLPGPVSTITLVTANLLIGNRHRTQALTTLAQVGSDFLVLIEATAADEEFFRAEPRWPHRHWHPHEGLGGIAVLSRYPLTLVRVMEDRHPILVAVVARIAGAPVLLLACHPVAPESWARTRERNGQFALIAALAAAHDGPVVAAGDFNCTRCAQAWGDFLAASQLSCHREGPATFPAILGACGIAIDHVLVRSAHITALDVQAIPGSDHRGLRCVIAWPT